MPQLFTLVYGKSKKKMKPIMVETRDQCEKYMKARMPNVEGWHDIIPAEKDVKTWRQKSSSIISTKCQRGAPVIGKNGQTRIAGYIGKNGFNPHT
jgi:hypothetical protein